MMSQYWYGFRCKPDGQSIAIGPYYSAEKANEERRKSKEIDVEVSPWFVADDKPEATKLAKWHLEGGLHPMHEKQTRKG